MSETPLPGIARPTPPHARPFSRPDGRPGHPTPLSTRAVLFVPGERAGPAEPLGAEAAPDSTPLSPVAADDREAPSPIEAVARTLESLAARVRDGQVALPPWIGGAGEAATLAGVLAALLSGAPVGTTGNPGGVGDGSRCEERQ